jgi:hypothetical protein
MPGGVRKKPYKSKITRLRQEREEFGLTLEIVSIKKGTERVRSVGARNNKTTKQKTKAIQAL